VAILLTCACGRQFQTGEENIGRRTRCPECGGELVIAEASPLVEFAAPAVGDPIRFPSSGRAMASLVLGLLSLVFAALTGIPAIVLGCLGLIDVKKSRGRAGGRAAAVSGIALGVFGSTVVTLAMLTPVYQAAREWQREKECADNLKRIALAMHNYHSDRRAFPPAAITDRQGQPLLSWRVAILPYLGLEEQELYQQFHLNEPWDSPNNRPLLDRMPAVYACPDEPRGQPPTTNYLVVVGPGKLFTGKRKGVKIETLTAGTSNTLMVTESDRPVPWTAPEDISADLDVEGPGVGSRHPGGYHIAMADGSVRSMSFGSSGNSKARGAAVTRNGGGPINRAATAPAVPTGQK
jgi:prepilin-type processing-associated H-X9-DG protein